MAPEIHFQKRATGSRIRSPEAARPGSDRDVSVAQSRGRPLLHTDRSGGSDEALSACSRAHARARGASVVASQRRGRSRLNVLPWRVWRGEAFVKRQLTVGGAHTEAEVADLTGFFLQTLIGFENEPGVIVPKRLERPHKRSDRSIRIPSAAFQRVLRELPAT